MDLALLQQLFMWCTIASLGAYLLSAVSILVFRGFVLALHERLFRMGEDAVDLAMHRFLSSFKLLVIVVSFVPWMALAILQ